MVSSSAAQQPLPLLLSQFGACRSLQWLHE